MRDFFKSRLFWIALIGSIVALLLPLKVSGYILGLLTVAYYFGVFSMAWDLLFGFAGFTGGEIGLTVPDVLSVDTDTNYYIALIFMLVSGIILFALSRSPVGLILQASGQDPIEAGALGFNVTKHKLFAFIISAFFSGLAGALLVFYMGTASVGTLVSISVAVQGIIAAVLGGRGTMIGAAIGAIFLIAAGEALRPFGELSTFIVSAIALVVILLVPSGLLGLFTRGEEHA